ncbi:MAG: heavy metal sensor histidine kinase [Pseudomonadota bacterium]
MRSLSLTARISMLFAACAAIVLLGLGWIVVRSVETHFLEIDRHEIEGKLTLVRNLLAKVDAPLDLDAIPGQLDDALVGHHGLSVALIAQDGSIWFTSQAQDFPVAPLLQAEPGRILTWTNNGRTYRGLTAPVAIGLQEPSRLAAAISLDITHHRQFRSEFLALLTFTTMLAALITAALGWLVTRLGLRPLCRMTALATNLSASHLSERIPEASLPVEIRSLAMAFNAMLARLESSFQRLSEFSSDIAHELRTPVSNLMTQTQVALSRARGADAYREVLYSSLEEYQRLAKMIGDMLFLAKTDNGLIVPGREPVDLAAEVGDLFTFYEALADEKGVELSACGAGWVSGDRLMLRRALSNLLSNAIQHTPYGGRISVTLRADDDRVSISVENPGEPIPQAQLHRIFDRFYRLDPSRKRSGDGAGLGLAITKSIVEAHGGTIEAHSNETIRFEIRLPGASAS